MWKGFKNTVYLAKTRNNQTETSLLRTHGILNNHEQSFLYYKHIEAKIPRENQWIYSFRKLKIGIEKLDVVFD